MSVLVSLLQRCPNLQGALVDTFQTCGMGAQEQYPFYEWVSNEMNNAGLQQQMVRGSKLRTVELIYDQRLKESEKKTGYVACVAETQRGNKKKEYTLDRNDTISFEEIISIDNLADICEEDTRRLLGILNRLIDAMDRAMATKITNQLVGLTGTWASDVSTTNNQLVVKTYKDNDQYTPFPYTMQQIDRSLRKSGYCQPPVIFGEDNLTDYYERTLAGCCATSGINIGDIIARYGKVVMYDRRVSEAFPGNTSIVTQGGALAMVTWNKYAWKQNIDQRFSNTGSELLGIITSPRTGNKMDLLIKYDCGNLSMIVTQTSRLFNMPDDMFQDGDIYDGVNFVNQILVTNVG